MLFLKIWLSFIIVLTPIFMVFGYLNKRELKLDSLKHKSFKLFYASFMSSLTISLFIFLPLTLILIMFGVL